MGKVSFICDQCIKIFRLVNDIEQTMHEWTQQLQHLKQENKQGIHFTQRKDFDYCGKKYELMYYNSDASSLTPHEDENQDEEDDTISKVERVLLNDETDFPTRAHHLHRWYGVDEFFIISVNKSSKRSKLISTVQEQQEVSLHDTSAGSRNISMSEAKILQSAIVIALHNTPLRRRASGGSYSMPIFVTVGKPAEFEYIGRWQHGSVIVKFRSEVVLKQKTAIPPLYTKVSGLFDLFCLLMGKHLTLRDLISKIRVYARYTYMLDTTVTVGKYLRKLEEDGIPFGCLDPNEPPISSYHLSPRFQTDMQSIETAQVERLNPPNADFWQVRCVKNKQYVFYFFHLLI